MNAKSEFSPGRSERWRHPEPSSQAGQRAAAAGTGRVQHSRRDDAFRDTTKLRFYSSTALKPTCNSVCPATVINTELSPYQTVVEEVFRYAVVWRGPILYIYIYIYIEREREREIVERDR